MWGHRVCTGQEQQQLPGHCAIPFTSGAEGAMRTQEHTGHRAGFTELVSEGHLGVLEVARTPTLDGSQGRQYVQSGSPRDWPGVVGQDCTVGQLPSVRVRPCDFAAGYSLAWAAVCLAPWMVCSPELTDTQGSAHSRARPGPTGAGVCTLFQDSPQECVLWEGGASTPDFSVWLRCTRGKCC